MAKTEREAMSSSSSWADQTDAELDEQTAKPPVNMWAKGNPLVKTSSPAESRNNNNLSSYDHEYPPTGSSSTPSETIKQRPSPRDLPPRDREYSDKNYERDEYSREERRSYSNYGNYSRDRDENNSHYRESPPPSSYYSRGRDRDMRSRGRDNRDRDYRDNNEYGRRAPSSSSSSSSYYNSDRRAPNRDPIESPDSTPRAPLPLPTSPPYTAFVGNLSYDVIDEDLYKFFGNDVTSVRLLVNKDTRRPKGFGYVEFETLEGLKKALERNGEMLFERPLRVDVASAKPEERPPRSSAFPPRSRDRDNRYSNRLSPRERDDLRDSSEAAIPPNATKVDDEYKPTGEESNKAAAVPEGSASPERRKLELKPRSDPTPIQQPALSDAYKKSTKANPFGNATPRDENLYLKKKEDDKLRTEAQPQSKDSTSTPATTSTSPRTSNASNNTTNASSTTSTAPATQPSSSSSSADNKQAVVDNRISPSDSKRGPTKSDYRYDDNRRGGAGAGRGGGRDRPPRGDDRFNKRDDKPRREYDRSNNGNFNKRERPPRGDDRFKRDDQRPAKRDEKPQRTTPFTDSKPKEQQQQQQQHTTTVSSNMFSALNEED